MQVLIDVFGAKYPGRRQQTHDTGGQTDPCRRDAVEKVGDINPSDARSVTERQISTDDNRFASTGAPAGIMILSGKILGTIQMSSSDLSAPSTGKCSSR